jgi:myo-inositol 2-dehydrogenase/D-chiro-inositol 1-dehydrogenase
MAGVSFLECRRTEIAGSKGSIPIESIQQSCVTFLGSEGGTQKLADLFLTKVEDAYVAEAQDFVQNMPHDRAPRVSGEDGQRALAIALAAEKSYHQSKACGVGPADEVTASGVRRNI